MPGTRGYVLAKRVGADGLWSELYAIAPKGTAGRTFGDFVSIVRDICAAQLDSIELLSSVD
ncbi:hypothetical protein [Paraburkholderia sp.]|jgi:LysR family transcriptional regulator for metE and metH|uniref:hypothetical protein n=1 Tax=Paraburkholderia sp. TaxID=1926495 RepID=UPI00397AE736